MTPFHVLIVEDQSLTADLLKQQLQSAKSELAPGGELIFQVARTQKEVDTLLQTVPHFRYDLVLLYLKYPDSDPAGPLEDNGIRWLPNIRASQPSAAIIVCTSYAHENFLVNVVEALRDGNADEFIPKETPWKETLSRIKAALDRAIFRQGARNSTQPQLSNVRRTVAEDQAMELARVQQSIGSLLDQIRSAAPAVSDTVDSIAGELNLLVRRLTEIGSSLTVDTATETEQVDCRDLADQSAAYFGIQMREFSGRVNVTSQDECVVQTYRNDLVIALRELVQNAVYSSREGGSENPVVNILVKRKGEDVIIQIDDSGKGFPAEVIASPVELNRSLWPDRSFPHSGMGLYVTNRMMHSIGGHLQIENAEGLQGRHGRATLIVRDWKMS